MKNIVIRNDHAHSFDEITSHKLCLYERDKGEIIS